MDQRKRTATTIPKELSWLAFNARVLQEAEDGSVPLIERVRFLGIFSNNLDEFFRVRFADVRRLAAFSKGKEKNLYNQVLEDIKIEVLHLQNRFDQAYERILTELQRRNIYMINELQLQPHQLEFVREYFFSRVLPDLAPIVVSDSMPDPQLDDASIYLAVKLLLCDDSIRYAILNIPTDTQSRFIRIPSAVKKSRKVVIVLENIIRACLSEVFRGSLDIKEAGAYTFKLGRDAELELGEGITQSILDRVESSLKKRRQAQPVRFVYDREMPADLVDLLVRRMRLGHYDSVIPGDRYHNSKDFIGFPRLGPKYMEYKPMQPLSLPELDRATTMFDAVRARDILLYYPYHSFSYIEELLSSAAIDPAVQSIQISLYRVAKNSHVGRALINAARNGKQVTAVVELQARFDEAANIDWAQRLTDAGVHVIFGIPGLKVHSKLILISRQEGHKLRYYAHIGTGNFNEKTARIYTDHSLLTADREIALEVKQVFEFIVQPHLRFKYRHLAVSPHTNRSTFLRLLHTEQLNARSGKPAEVMIKCNNLVDEELIKRLYEASRAGVRIRIIVRGMCSLIPGIPGLSDNIEAISIVDRFLEHSRFYVFHNDGDPRYYISSADLMTRNLDHRVEVSCPVYASHCRRSLRELFELQWSDTVKARRIDATLSNTYRPRRGRRKIRSQELLYKHHQRDIERQKRALNNRQIT